jgi:hypothetical protein
MDRHQLARPSRHSPLMQIRHDGPRRKLGYADAMGKSFRAVGRATDGGWEMQGVAASRATNEELTELALDSAIALDKRLQDQPADSHVVTVFLDALAGIVNVPDEQAAGRLIPDPRKVGVVTRAYRSLQRENHDTVNELIERIKRMAQTYRDNPAGGMAELQSLRDFCIALHKELLAYALRSYDAERRRDAGKQNAA